MAFQGFLIFPQLVHHSFRYESYIRNTKVLNQLCPLFMRDYCGPNLGNVLGYTLSIDKRDSSVFATQGGYIRGSFDLIDNSVKHFGHLKNDVHLEYNHPITNAISLQICARVGKIFRSLQCDKISVTDMFYIGGPQTLRGFCTAGANMQKDNVCIGANSYWVCGFHIWSKLPFHSYFGNFSNLIRMQLFYNVGRVDAFNFRDINSTIGGGLAFKLGEKARIELNYCVPLRFQNINLTRNFQFGIGYDFV